MCYNFDHKVVIITGGLSGIGLATAIKLLHLGAKIVIGDLQGSESYVNTLQELKSKGASEKNVHYVQIDSAKHEDNKLLVDSAISRFGDLHYVFANAGVGRNSFAHELEIDEWQKVIDINLTGVFSLNKLAISYWLDNNKKGAIVNTGSIMSFVGNKGSAHYCASKGAVKLLTQTLALEYISKGIRINSVNPGYLITPMLKSVPLEERNAITNLHPIGRLGEASEVANAVAFLLSDEASFINGTSLLVDGGYTAQ